MFEKLRGAVLLPLLAALAEDPTELKCSDRDGFDSVEEIEKGSHELTSQRREDLPF